MKASCRTSSEHRCLLRRHPHVFLNRYDYQLRPRAFAWASCSTCCMAVPELATPLLLSLPCRKHSRGPESLFQAAPMLLYGLLLIALGRTARPVLLARRTVAVTAGKRVVQQRNITTVDSSAHLL